LTGLALVFGFVIVYYRFAGIVAFLGLLVNMIILFGAFALVDGVLGVWSAFSSRKDRNNWWVLMLWGLVGIGIGIITFVAPAVTALALLFYIAIWAIVSGVLEIIAAVKLRKEIQGEWLLGLAGLLSLVFGILLIMHPGAGVLAVLWLIAAYALILGVLMVILAFKVRGWGTKLKSL
jgi:uncharacterized membrane protein HdeD (DUF308 family)